LTKGSDIESEEILLNSSQVRDGGRVDDEGEGSVATCDGKKAKVNGATVERRAAELRRKENKETYEKGPNQFYTVYSQSPFPAETQSRFARGRVRRVQCGPTGFSTWRALVALADKS